MATTSVTGSKVVFVDTSLDTQIAMTLPFSYTVADFKNKIRLQHEQCFSKIGAVTVHLLKVKHHGKLYDLPESLVVSSAYEGYERRWSLFADISTLEVVKEQSLLDPCDRSLEKSVAEPRENMASPDVPSQLVQKEQLVISASTKKKRKREKQYQGSVLEEACDGQIVGSGNHGMINGESLLTSDTVETTPAKEEIVICLANDEFLTSKIRKSRKSVVRKHDQLDVQHDRIAEVFVAVEGAAPRAHIEDQPRSDENVENSELAKNVVPVAVCSGGSLKHLDSVKPNLKEKESASDIALNVRVELEGGKSACRSKKKTKKSSSKNDYYIMERTKDANDPLGLKNSCYEFIPSDVMPDQSIVCGIGGTEKPKMVSPTNYYVTCIEGMEKTNMVSPTDSYKNGNGNTKKKQKRKAKRSGKSGEGLAIPEVNPENIGEEKLASLVEKSSDVDYADTLKVNGSDEKRTIDQSCVLELGQGKNPVLKGTANSEQVLQNSDSPEVPAHEIESNCEVRHATVVSMANNGLESKGGNGPVSFRRYFAPGDDHKGAASADKVEGESNVVVNVKALKKCVDPAIINDSYSTTLDTRQSEGNNGSSTSSNLNSVSRDSNKILLNKSNQKKQTSVNLKNTAAGEISKKKVKDVEKSSQERSLLTTPSIVFGDGLSESSGDENENGNMKFASSTQSPSDCSLSSSPEELMRQGSINKDHKGGKTALCSKLADTRNMSVDMILTSSSRFKKAKLAASRFEADSEQVDFVLESQPMH